MFNNITKLKNFNQLPAWNLESSISSTTPTILTIFVNFICLPISLSYLLLTYLLTLPFRYLLLLPSSFLPFLPSLLLQLVVCVHTKAPTLLTISKGHRVKSKKTSQLNTIVSLLESKDFSLSEEYKSRREEISLSRS